MAQLVRVSKVYAEALFNLAVSENVLENLENDARLVLDTLKADNDLFKVLTHPQVTFEEKMGFLEKTFKGNVSDHILGLLSVLLKKNHSAETKLVLTEFLRMVLEHNRITVCQVTSAIPLTDKQREDIVSKLSAKLNKTIKLEETVDPQLIGGMSVTVDGRVLDSSIKTQLGELKKKLLDLQLA